MLTLKKSLGQHFLVDEQVCLDIVASLRQTSFTRLAEVGPGGGALTKYLLQIPDVSFKCIEIDTEKVNYLLKTYPRLEGKIIHDDILKIAPPFELPFTMVGNFPYNISTEIVFKVLEWREKIEQVTGMFQKEVAERIAAKEGSKIYGVTSVLVQAFFKVEYLFEVPETAFNPPPKVKSAVIRLTPLAEVASMRNHSAFRTLVKAAFNQRRKTLRNAVRSLFENSELSDPIFNKRAEELTVEQFAALTYRMSGGSK